MWLDVVSMFVYASGYNESATEAIAGTARKVRAGNARRHCAQSARRQCAQVRCNPMQSHRSP